MIGLSGILMGLVVITLSVLYFVKVRADKDKKHSFGFLLLSIFLFAPVVLALIYFFILVFGGTDRVK
jgi:heme/copper-type cytochrome/quinol oxidase subunit 4